MVGSIISGVTSIIGANKQAKAAKNAANAEIEAAQLGIDEQRRQFDLSREDQKPFLETGTAGIQELGRRLGVSGDASSAGYGGLLKNFTTQDFETDPGYAFRLAEGQKALDRVASKNGKVFSGGALKDANSWAQGLASQEFQNAYDRFNTDQTTIYNRLAGISGTGQTAANTLGTLGANEANQISDLGTQQGNARASGIIGQNNAWQTGLNAIGNTLGSFFTGGGSTAINPANGFGTAINWN